MPRQETEDLHNLLRGEYVWHKTARVLRDGSRVFPDADACGITVDEPAADHGVVAVQAGQRLGSLINVGTMVRAIRFENQRFG